MRNLFLLVFCLLSTILLNAQENSAKIEFEIDNYPNDTLIVGNYFGSKTLVFDTLISTDRKHFTLETDTLMPSGVYIALFKPDNDFVQFVVNSKDQHFKLKGAVGQSIFEPSGSIDNELFYEYMKLIQSAGKERKVLRGEIDTLKKQNLPTEEQEKRIRELDKSVESMQKQILDGDKSLILYYLIKSQDEVDVPSFEEIKDEDERKLKRYMYYKEHYFDNIEMTDPIHIRTPYFNEKINFYMEKLTPQHPDSIYESVDFILKKLEPTRESFQFYTSTFLNKYGNSNIIGYDAIFVKLVDNYYAAGRTPWTSDESLNKFKENAAKLKPILIGKQAPPITFYYEDGQPFNLYDLKSPYTIMVFWAPDCGHCKKAMPELKKFYNEYKSKGVEIVGICTKHRNKYNECWEFTKEKELPWITVGDQYHRSNFRELYNVVSTPRVFILNDKKEILLKRVPSDKLGEIMESLIKEVEEKKANK